MCRLGAGIKVNRHVITRSCQHLSLPDDRLWVLVTQQYECNFRHYRNDLPVCALIVYPDNGEKRLNKQAFFASFNQLKMKKPEKHG
jgi:hypothetical protein